MSVLDKVRRWIDGETAELVLEEAARDAQVKPRSQAEEFIVKIAREVEGVMQRELVPLPQGTTIIPSEYAIVSDPDEVASLRLVSDDVVVDRDLRAMESVEITLEY